MVSEKLLKKYAKMAVKVGANVQKGQALFIQSPTFATDYVELCAQAAYELGASKVIVKYDNEEIERLHYLYQETEILTEIPQYKLDEYQYLMDSKVARLRILSPMPGILQDVDSKKVQDYNVALMSQPIMQEWKRYSMNNTTQWCLVAVPNQMWADLIFPNQENNVELLWNAIFKACRVNEDECVAKNWEKHNEMLHNHNQLLNDYNFKSLRFTNSLGTNIKVGLVKDHVWAGGSETALNGVVFNPNMPTEESFTMPDRNHVDGRVYATKPLNYNGVLIDKFWVEFKDGKVVDFDALQNKAALESLLNFDEGAKHIGEIALISHNSPISNMNILFYNTLYDENASCHMALGAAYPMNLKGGSSMSQEQLLQHGANTSGIHYDFMFGSEDMSVIGITYSGEEVVVFEKGNFVF